MAAPELDDSSEAVGSLVAEWEHRRAGGESVSVEEVCRDHPQWLDRVRQEVAALERFNRLVGDPGPPLRPEAPIAVGDTLKTESHLVVGLPHARGGIGEVFLAHDAILGRDVALKFMRDQRPNSRERQDRFLREARIAARLEHPGSVPVYGLGQDAAGRACYAMRFIAGETLQAAIERFHHPPITRLKFHEVAFRQLLTQFVTTCNTIAYAHDRGIVHRDIKPANIMLGRFGETVVVDWGLAKETTGAHDSNPSVPSDPSDLSDTNPSLTQAGAALGTLAFMSPEQARGDLACIGPASDIFSLGATLYTLLVGKAPHQGKSATEVARLAIRGDFPSPRSMQRYSPRALDAIVRKCTRPEPDQRYATALALVADLEHWLADAPVSVHFESLSERAGRLFRRYRQASLWGAAFISLAVIALTWGLWRITLAQRLTSAAYHRAESALGTARDAIDELYTKISQNQLLHEPGAESLRKELLQSARVYYERLRREQASSAELRIDAARAAVQVADITSDIDSPAKALPVFRQALEQLEELPPTLETLRELARASGAMAAALSHAEKLPEAETAFERALEIQARIQSMAPDDLELTRDRAEIQANLARTKMILGKPDEAMRLLQDAMTTYDQILEKVPLDRDSLQGISVVYANRGVFLRMRGESAGTKEAYEQSIEFAQQLTRLDPKNDSYKDNLAVSLYNLANFLRDAGNLDLAREHQVQAVGIYRRLTTEFPLRTTYRIRLAKAVHNLGAIEWTAGRLPEAREVYEDAVQQYDALAQSHPALSEVAQDLKNARRELGEIRSEFGATGTSDPSDAPD